MFEHRHDALRALLVDTVRRCDPSALHVDAPAAPAGHDQPSAAIWVEPAGRREPTHASEIVVVPGTGIDGRSFAGLGLMAVGVATMLLAVATGTFQLAVGGVALGSCLGWVGSRFDRH